MCESNEPNGTLTTVIAQCVLLGLCALVKHGFQYSPTVSTDPKPPRMRLFSRRRNYLNDDPRSLFAHTTKRRHSTSHSHTPEGQLAVQS